MKQKLAEAEAEKAARKGNSAQDAVSKEMANEMNDYVTTSSSCCLIAMCDPTQIASRIACPTLGPAEGRRGSST